MLDTIDVSGGSKNVKKRDVVVTKCNGLNPCLKVIYEFIQMYVTSFTFHMSISLGKNMFKS